MTAVLGLASRGVRSSTVRLPRTGQRRGNGGFAGLLTNIARQSGVSGYPGDGTQRWPAVHALDAASLFRLALEHAPAGTSWHAVDDEGDAVRDIAAVIGRRLNLQVESVEPATYGALGAIFPRPISHPRAPTPARRSAGSRRVPPSWKTWRTSSPEMCNALGSGGITRPDTGDPPVRPRCSTGGGMRRSVRLCRPPTCCR